MIRVEDSNSTARVEDSASDACVSVGGAMKSVANVAGATNIAVNVIGVQEAGVQEAGVHDSVQDKVREEMASDVASDLMAVRQRHRARLNKIVNESRKRSRESDTLACSKMSWFDLQRLYAPMMKKYRQCIEPIPEAKVNVIREEIESKMKAYKTSAFGPERKKSSFVETLIYRAANLFDEPEGINLEFEARLASETINARGTADFLVSRGPRKVLVVEAKKENMEQGLAQDLVMLDIAMEMNETDKEHSDVIHGIVTDFKSWVFIRSAEGVVQYETDSIAEDQTLAEDVERIVGKIYHILKYSI